MSVRGVLSRGRRRHEQLMVETCQVRRQTGQSMDPDTDRLVPTYLTVYDGRCRVKAYRIGKAEQAGDVAVEVQRYEVHIPMSTTESVSRGDVVTVTGSDDAWLAQRPLTVTDVSYGGTTTARHLIVEDRS